MSKRKSAEAAPITIFPGDRTPSEFEIQALYEAVLRRQREFYGAASTTVEALIYELRTSGLAALAGSNCRRRLAELNREQLQDMIRRLMRLRPRYPAITDELLFQLGEQKRTSDNFCLSASR